MAFSDREIRAMYVYDLRRHDVPVIARFLAERQGLDLHVIARVDTPSPQPLLPWDNEDAWLFSDSGERN
jgi:hypothetical protein